MTVVSKSRYLIEKQFRHIPPPFFKLSADDGDKEYATDRDTFIVWATGRLDSQNEPSFHDTYSKANIKVNFSSKEPIDTCFSFTTTNDVIMDAWEKGQIYDRTIRVFNAYVGPSGGKKGYQATTGKLKKCGCFV